MSTSSSNHDEEADILQAMHLASLSSLPFTLKTAIDLGLFEIISKSDCRMLSASEIASQLPTVNPTAPTIIDRILRLLAIHSILNCSQDGRGETSYGLTSVGKYFLQNEGGISFASLQDIYLEKYNVQCWKYLKDVTLEGGFSFEKAFGKHLFEVLANDDAMSKTFNQAMSIYTDLVMNRVLETYNGFEGVKQVVDVGGGLGKNLNLIVSKYPQIKGINFDLPQVIKDAVPSPGVEHLAGDMFTEIPKAEVIFMKNVLHNWGDDLCLKLLKACYDALPENGKIVSVESVVILREAAETDIIAKTILQRDLLLFQMLPGAKERTEQEFEALTKQAGFSCLKIICRAYNQWVMEIYKTLIDSDGSD